MSAAATAVLSHLTYALESLAECRDLCRAAGFDITEQVVTRAAVFAAAAAETVTQPLVVVHTSADRFERDRAARIALERTTPAGVCATCGCEVTAGELCCLVCGPPRFDAAGVLQPPVKIGERGQAGGRP